MRIKLFVVAAIAGTLFISACGKKTKSDGAESGAADPIAASDVADESVDEATDAISEGGSNGSASLAEDVFNADGDTITLSKVCTASAGNAVVDVTASGEATRSRSASRKIGEVTFTNKITMTGGEKRTWTKATAGSDLSCSAGNSAVIGWATPANVEGLKLNIDVDRKRDSTVSMAYSVLGQSKTKERTKSTTIKGNRKVEFSSATVSATEVSVEKKVSISDLARTSVGTNFEGEATSTTTKTSTKTDAPLVVNVVRDRGVSALTWKTRTIKSGTLVVTLENGSRVESTFSNVVYSKTADNVCTPNSGTIEGQIFDAEATTATHTFTITFEATKITKTFDGVEVSEYSPSQSCDLAKE